MAKAIENYSKAADLNHEKCVGPTLNRGRGESLEGAFQQMPISDYTLAPQTEAQICARFTTT